MAQPNNNDKISKEEVMGYLSKVEKKSLVLSIMNQYIFTKAVTENSCLTIINCHHALLPGHRGRNAYAWNIYTGDEAGITWHIVNDGVDTGRVIKSYPVEIKEDDTSLSLLYRENETVKKTLQELLPDFLRENYPFEKPRIYQDYIHKKSDIPNQGLLDLSWHGEKISRFLRCMDFGPLRTFGRPYFIFENKNYVVKRYKILKDETATYAISKINEEEFCIKRDGYIFSLTVILNPDVENDVVGKF